MRLVVDLPFATPSLNEILGWAHSDKARWVSGAFKRKCASALKARLTGWPPNTNKRVRVRFIRYSAGELDGDNLSGGFKPLRDALKKLGVIVDDSGKWLEAQYEQVKTVRGDKRTRLEIEVMG